MCTYLSLLPDEVHRHVYKFLYDACVYEIEAGGGLPVYPLDLYYAFCAENSDYIRADYLKRMYIQLRLDSDATPDELLFLKLLLDLERPTVYCSPLANWKHHSVRRWEHMTDGELRGGLYWNGAEYSSMLSAMGWARLTEK